MRRFRSLLLIPLLSSWLGATVFADVSDADREEDGAGGELVGVWHAAGAGRVSVPMRVHREQQGEGRVSIRLGSEGERFVGEFLRISDLLPGGANGRCQTNRGEVVVFGTGL